MPDILALDLATTCGFARGRVDATPVCGSIRFGKTGASPNAVFAAALRWFTRALAQEPKPDLLILESMLSPDAKTGLTNRDVRDRLAGLHGCIRGVAHLNGIYEIDEATVGDVRAHFIQDRTLKRDPAKRAVLERCRQLGWISDADLDAADALALWSYARSRIDPERGLEVVPMFNRSLRG